ncbi:MAG: hypothetical protein ACLPY1_01915, partial [Terracidiphilus sp.]
KGINILGEVKDTAKLNLTNQIKDFFAYAKDNPGMKVNFFTRNPRGSRRRKFSRERGNTRHEAVRNRPQGIDDVHRIDMRNSTLSSRKTETAWKG